MLLVIVNLLMLAVGGVMLIIGIVFKLGKEDLIPELSGYSTSMAGVTLAFIVVGAVIALVGFLGCMGAILKKNGILNFYFLIVLVTLLLQIALIVYTILKKDAVIDQLTIAVKETFAKVKGNNATENEKLAVSSMQWTVECCGLESADYWGTDLVPAGCCESYDGTSTKEDCPKADAWKAGCMDAGPAMMEDSAWTLLIIVIIIMVVEIVCMLAACYSKKQELIA